MKIVNYTILRARSHSDLVDEVNYYIQKGWQPLGGVAEHAHGFAQAMVVYSP